MDNSETKKKEEEMTQEQVDAFLKDYGEIVVKHKMDIFAFPTFIPDNQGAWVIKIQTRVISTKNQPVKSPFMVG